MTLNIAGRLKIGHFPVLGGPEKELPQRGSFAFWNETKSTQRIGCLLQSRSNIS